MSARNVSLAEGWPQRITAIANDLRAHRGAGLVVAGESQPPVVHALAHLMNQTLGNAGSTVLYIPAGDMPPVDEVESIKELTADMEAGHVDLLVILGGNPVYTAPVDVPFLQALAKVQTRVHLSLYADETSEWCQWQIPEAHFLEAWSDARAFDGTASIVQPMIAPLYGGHSAHEVLGAMSDRPERPAHDIVREYWIDHPVASATTRNEQGAATAEFDRNWRKWLNDGVISQSAPAARTVSLKADRVAQAAAVRTEPTGTGFEIAFRLDPSILDGRFSNNGWLQELPKPITRLTWDNAVMASPATIDRLKEEGYLSFQGGEHGQYVSDVVTVNYQGRSVRGPIFAVVGHPDDCVTVHLGFGRTRAGHVGNGAGFNAYAIRTSGALWSGRGTELLPTGDKYSLACTQYHHLMEGRGMVRAATRDEFVKDPKIVHEGFEVAAANDHAVPRLQVRRLQVGHGDRRERVHRVQRVRCGMPVGEQHRGDRQGAGAARPRDALASNRLVLLGRDAKPSRRTFSPYRACSARTHPAKWCARSRRRCTATKG